MMGDWVNLYYGVDRETNKNYESRQGKGKKIKSLPAVLLATAKQQTYIVELTNLVPLKKKKKSIFKTLFNNYIYNSTRNTE